MRENKKNETLYIATMQFDITPDYPVSLLGYFNERISTAVLDPLYCRIASIERGEKRLLFIQVDSCLIPYDDAEKLKNQITQKTSFRKDEILVFASHTHTAPALSDFFGAKKEHSYSNALFTRILERVEALKPAMAASVKIAKTTVTDLSHNRRWFMKDGRVMTNPPKGSPIRERPEGRVDPEIWVIGLYLNDETPGALFINISNHTDTVGGNRITADWPGFLERYINETLKSSITVFPLISPQGNINHFDFDSPHNQTFYGEAERIGKSYAQSIIELLPHMEEIPSAALLSSLKYVEIPPREVTEDDTGKAKVLLRETGSMDNVGDLTAEDLAKGNPWVERLFAEELLRFTGSQPKVYRVPLQILGIGPIRICAIPGEPFVEIGLELKQADVHHRVIPVALANGYFGYIPLEECFDRGGYETRPSRYNCLSCTAARIILSELKSMLRNLS